MVYTSKIFPKKIVKEYSPQIFDEVYYIQSDEDIAKRVYAGLENKFEKIFLQKIQHTFLCDTKEYEMHLLNYIIGGFKQQSNLLDISNQDVYFIDSIQKELFKMAHKYKGFIRFQELATKEMFAVIEPKYNILPLVVQHFVGRYKYQDFIIYDSKRSIALIYLNQVVKIENIVGIDDLRYSDSEQEYQKLWKSFFKSVSIKERENSKLQQNFIPLWYRKHLTEFIDI
jgi:probable DNA metabolism protein